MRWTIFFVKEFRIHPVGITLHCQRSIAKMRQKDWRDPNVVIDHLAFGEPDFRVKNLVQVGNRELFSFNDEFSFLWHTILSCRHLERNASPAKSRWIPQKLSKKNCIANQSTSPG